jgi:hypothetical protein
MEPIEISYPPLQLPLQFGDPSRSVLTLSCTGLTVLAEAPPGAHEDVLGALRHLGITPEVDAHDTIRFPLRQLPLLSKGHSLLRLRPDDTIGPLLELLTTIGSDSPPAVVDLDPTGDLVLTWSDRDGNWERTLDRRAAGTLVAAGVSFVATPPAWNVLREAKVLPEFVATARAGLDGFLEVTATLPQLVEGAPIPGLFRISPTQFGVPSRYYDQLRATPGFRWHGPPPTRASLTHGLALPPIELSVHHQTDLREVVERLEIDEALVLVWQSGLGRRIMALAAVEALENWPCLVVCTPASVWSWQRHVELLGRSSAITHSRADVRIMTYQDLARGLRPPSPAAIILDEILSDEARHPAARAALTRLSGLAGVPRLAVCDEWVDDPAEALAVLSLLRPHEFDPSVPLAQRYPSPAERRALEHIESYLSRRLSSDPDSGDVSGFHHSGVRVLRPRDAQLRLLEEARWQAASQPQRALAEMLEMVSAGPTSMLSPKVATAARMAQHAHAGQRRVAVITRHARTAALIRSTLRPTPCLVHEGDGPVPEGPLVIIRYDRAPGDVRWADEVIVVDYPWSSTSIDQAVGSAGTRGARRVTVLHLAGTIDDRLALLAARRRELGSVADPTAPPSETELAFLLDVPESPS